MQVAGEAQEEVNYPQVVLDTIENIEESCKVTPVVFLKTSKASIFKTEKNEEFFCSLGLMFTKVANLSGLKGEISDINKQDIEDLILDFNQALSLDEIYFAFKLERYNQYEEKTKHYEMFGAEYVSEVLKKYKKWKQKTKVQFNIQIISELPEKKELTVDEKKSIVEKGVERMFEDYKATKDVPFGCVYIYDFLIKKGELKTPTNPSRKQIKRKARSNVNQFNKNKKAHSIFSAVFHKGNINKQIEDECKRLALIEYFEEKLKNENS